MKEKTAKLLTDALEETFEAVGLSVTDFAAVVLGMPIPDNYRKFIRMGYKGYFTQQFKKQPEPNKEQLARMLGMIEQLGKAPRKMRSIMKQTLKTLPRDLGGSTRKVSVEDERVVCAEIMAFRSEYDNRQAIRVVARKRQASERTIYRIWGKYHPKKRKSAITTESH